VVPLLLSKSIGSALIQLTTSAPGTLDAVLRSFYLLLCCW
jgi:hypothetical protein